MNINNIYFLILSLLKHDLKFTESQRFMNKGLAESFCPRRGESGT